MLYRLLTHTVCEQATMGVFTGNYQFCSVSQLSISTIAESNISNSAQDRDLLSQLPQQLPQALKPWKSPSI